MTHAAARVDWICQVQDEDRGLSYFAKILRQLLFHLSGRSKGIQVYAAVLAPLLRLEMLKILILGKGFHLFGKKYLCLLHLLPGKLQLFLLVANSVTPLFQNIESIL